MPAFTPFELTNQGRVDLRANPHPTLITTWNGDAQLELPATGTHFGFVQGGSAELACASGTFRLQPGMYFSVAGTATLRGGCGLVITREGYCGFFHLGGPIEGSGRLRYIDGCTDSLLIPPVKLGDACLNLLHIPPNTRQSAHTHPSVRVGLIVSGSGLCVTPEREFTLRPGLAFVIAAEQLHSFHTRSDSLVVVAYHPDSDFGPTDECHPMVNRTILPPWAAAGSAAPPLQFGNVQGHADAKAAEPAAVHRREDRS